MDLSKLKEADLFGRFFLKASDGGRFDGYYCSLKSMYPLLRSKQWVESVTGYYINVTESFDAVRLSYFTPSPGQPKEVADDFIAKHGLENIKDPTLPVHTRNSEGYGGEELRFRRFLSTYTLIGLDIMEAELLNAWCLFATFRWQVMRAGLPYKPHFLRTFERDSSFFKSLSSAEKEQFWLDLGHWPDPQQVDWAHMFVNMVLGCDWLPVWDAFHSPQPALSIPQINDLVREQGLEIPQDWTP